MSSSGDRDWYLPSNSIGGYNWIAEVSQHGLDHVQSTSSLSMNWEDGFQSVDPESFDASIRSSPTPPSSVLTVVPSAPDQAGEQPLSVEHPGFRRTAPVPGTLIWPTNTTSLGHNPGEDNEKTGVPTRNHAYYASFHSSFHSPSNSFNLNSSDQDVHAHIPTTGTNADMRGQSARPRTVNRRSITSFPSSLHL
jgi:hypothetical protein